MSATKFQEVASCMLVSEREADREAAFLNNLPQKYNCLQQYFIHATSVDPAEVKTLQNQISNLQGQSYLKSYQARLQLAALLYCQGKRSEARNFLRSIDGDLPDNNPQALSLKIRAALVLAAAGDVHSALQIVCNLGKATRGFDIGREIEEILPFFESLVYKSARSWRSIQPSTRSRWILSANF